MKNKEKMRIIKEENRKKKYEDKKKLKEKAKEIFDSQTEYVKNGKSRILNIEVSVNENEYLQIKYSTYELFEILFVKGYEPLANFNFRDMILDFLNIIKEYKGNKLFKEGEICFKDNLNLRTYNLTLSSFWDTPNKVNIVSEKFQNGYYEKGKVKEQQGKIFANPNLNKWQHNNT